MLLPAQCESSSRAFGPRGYEYDRLGNRKKKLVGTGDVTYTYDTGTQRLMGISGAPETATLTYDVVGNLTGDGTGAYTWTAFDLLATATVSGATTTYGYDGENQRKRRDGPDGVRYYMHGPGGQPIAEYRETPGGPALVREYIYLGTKLLASSTHDDAAPAGGRVAAVSVSPQSQPFGTSVSVTVTGAPEPCSKVEVDFGDGTVTPYTIASPYALPLVVTHTYAAAGAYTVIARGQTGTSGPCLGVVSAPLEVTSGNVVDNGDFSQVDGNGLPIGWGIYTQGGQGYWNATSGVFNFYRTAGMNQAVTLQYTGLALATAAPLELTFRMGNSDTVRKRLSVMIHTPTFDDLALCTFWLDPQQPLKNYAMRMHTTKAWADATASFYAADVNAQGSTGAYQLDDVALTYRPALSSAKTDCVDPLAPASGGDELGNFLVNSYFTSGIASWSVPAQPPLVSQVVSETLEFYRIAGSPPPVISQATAQAANQDQRLAAIFELGNTSSVRQRITVQLQDANGADYTNCVFWLAPGTPKQAFAMTTYAGLAWSSATIAVAPATVGNSSAYEWLQLDTVSLAKITQATLGTECFEPGSFIVQGGAPAPVPDAVLVQSSAFTVDHLASSPAHHLTRVPQSDDLAIPSGPSSTAPAAQAVTVSVLGTGTGTVTSSPGGVTCGNYYVVCTGWFGEGATVTLTATPDANQTFVGWTGACTGTSPCVVSVVGPQQVGALFGAALTFYHLDAQGSVRMITNAAGNVVIRRDYFAFGEETGALTGDPRRFTGKELDPETAFHYFGARYHRGETGRFASMDPAVDITLALGTPQRWNRYAYALNNPLRFCDPTGELVELIGTAEERQRAFDLLVASVDPDVAKQLYILKVPFGNGFRYFAAISGDLGKFMSAGPTAYQLGSLIMRKEIVEFGLTSQDLSRHGGAVTLEPGERGNENTRVLVNPVQVRLNPLNYRSIFQATRFDGQTASNPAVVRPMTAQVAAWHEFGHAWGLVHGRTMSKTNPEAVYWENQMRAFLYGPLGQKNAPRRIH